MSDDVPKYHIPLKELTRSHIRYSIGNNKVDEDSNKALEVFGFLTCPRIAIVPRKDEKIETLQF